MTGTHGAASWAARAAKGLGACAVFLLMPVTARADIPYYGGIPSRAGDGRVSVQLVFSYHVNEYDFHCHLASIGRWRADAPEDSEPEVWLTVAELDHEECACYLPWQWNEPEPVVDATGQECTWQGTSAMGGTCPEPFFCHCQIYCSPVFDEPCDGDYRYSRDLWELESRITVDWRGPCPDASLPQGRPSQGCGCQAPSLGIGAGPLPHVIVLLLFSLAALMPWAWHRRRGRGPKAARTCTPRGSGPVGKG